MGWRVGRRGLQAVGEETIAIICDRCWRLELGGSSVGGEKRLTLRYIFKGKLIEVQYVCSFSKVTEVL